MPLAPYQRIEPRTVEFHLNLDYPLFLDGVHIADIEVTAEFACPADEPRSWGLVSFEFDDLNNKVHRLRGKALQDAEQVLIKHHDSYITERAFRAVQEAL